MERNGFTSDFMEREGMDDQAAAKRVKEARKGKK
jgi:hypothetical protein